MTVYPSDVVYTHDGSVIALHYVESMRLTSEEDKIVDILKGDINLVVSMVSGKEHRISMLKIISEDSRYTNTDCEQLMAAIVDRWKHILTRV